MERLKLRALNALGAILALVVFLEGAKLMWIGSSLAKIPILLTIASIAGLIVAIVGIVGLIICLKSKDTEQMYRVIKVLARLVAPCALVFVLRPPL